MSQRWLEFLEKIGKKGFVPPTSNQSPLSALNREQLEWTDFWDFDVLYHLYGPDPASVWHPFHCPTFFAGIQNLKLTPRKASQAPVVGQMYDQDRPPAPYFQWLDSSTATVIDVPGGEAVQIAAALHQMRHVQLIATFDHWPLLNEVEEDLYPAAAAAIGQFGQEDDDDFVVADPTETEAPSLFEQTRQVMGHMQQLVQQGGQQQNYKDQQADEDRQYPVGFTADGELSNGVNPDVAIDSRDVYDAMATGAVEVFRRRQQWEAEGSFQQGAPVWMCDSRRLIPREMEEGEYDNRYFIDPSLLPTAAMFQRQGITRAVYWRSQASDSYLEDIAWWFAELEAAGITVLRVDLDDPQTWVAPRKPVLPPAVMEYEGPSFYQSKSGGFGAYFVDPEEDEIKGTENAIRFGVGRRRLTSHSG